MPSRLSEYVTSDGSTHAVIVSAEEHEALLETLEIVSDSANGAVRTGLDELASGDTVSFEDVLSEPR